MKIILTFQQTKELLGTTNGHLRSLVFHKKIPFLKLNRLIRFDYDDLIEWINSNKKNVEVDNEKN